jgi:hypothetical protein
MSAEPRTETGHTPKEILLDAAEAIQLAGDYLRKAGDATHGYDPKIVKQILAEQKALDGFLAKLTEARTISDNDLFTKAAAALKLETPSLRTVSDRVKEIASGTATPPGVSGHMEQTVTFIAQAVVYISELP